MDRPHRQSDSPEFEITKNQNEEDSFHNFNVGAVAVKFHGSVWPVCPLHTKNGAQVGLLVGFPICREKSIIQTAALELEANESDIDSFVRLFEQEIYSFSGKWLAILSVGDINRVYLDADGTLPLLYMRESGKVASSASCMLSTDEYESRFHSSFYAQLDVANSGWFPSGLTAHCGVSRLMCNHYLDMGSMEAVRHWPRHQMPWVEALDDSAKALTRCVRRQVEALCAQGKVVCALTAGLESRFLLSCLAPLRGKVFFVTIALPGAELDVEVSVKLAQKFGLNHRVLPAIQSTDSQRAEWEYRASHCVGGFNRDYHASLGALSEYDFFVGGLGGEVGRGFLWRTQDNEQTVVSASDLLVRMKLPQIPELLSATQEWLDSVTDFNSLTQLDLAYLELRMSAWAFAQAYSQDFMIQHFHPLICRETYSLMLSLPPSEKKNGDLLLRSIELEAPELLDTPINKFGDYRDFMMLLRKVAQPRRLYAAIRKRIG